MTIIRPVSDLRNYNKILEHVSSGTPVYLTVNGVGKYIIRDIKDDEEIMRLRTMIRLLSELNKGRRSGEEEGYVDAAEVRQQILDMDRFKK